MKTYTDTDTDFAAEPAEALEHAVRSDANAAVRWWAVQHPSCPASALEHAVRCDADADVRRCAVQHPSCPAEARR